MNKKVCNITNSFLLIWFFLDMIGFSIGNLILVEKAWKEDGSFFLFYLALFILFGIKDKYGKYPLALFLIFWLVIQFLNHWYYTIFGISNTRLSSYNDFFSHTYHIIPASNSVLVPDFYHMLLHALIAAALISTVAYLWKRRG